MLKPLDGAGAKNTMRVMDEDDLVAALERLMPTRERPIQGEEVITGEEHTYETVMIEGKPVWQSSTYYLPRPLEVLENPWMQYCVLLPREQAEPHGERAVQLMCRRGDVADVGVVVEDIRRVARGAVGHRQQADLPCA